MTHIFLSPHLDDAVLSCGGAIAALRARGERVVVVTVCTGLPRPPYSSFAEELHARMGLSADEAVRARLREDETAMQRLGVEAIRLDQLDAIYRRPDAYASTASLFGAPAEGDALALPPLEGTIYAPLAVGMHVDHQLVHRAAPAGALLYEDLPYALEAGAIERRVPAGARPHLVDVTPFVETWLDAIACYPSQLGYLFGSERSMRERVSAYASSLAPGGAWTRFWR